MSANNCFVLKLHNGTWYGWDTCAEQTIADEEDNGGVRVLKYSEAKAEASSIKSTLFMLEHTEPITGTNDLELTLDQPLNYSEYGTILGDRLPKDGTEIRYE